MVQQYLPKQELGDILNLPIDQVNRSSPRRRRYAVRDSEARFNRVGKPGSKRHQRYLNNTFLQDQHWDLSPEDFEIVRFSCSPFAALFDEENRRRWEPFVDITEEEQRDLLAHLHCMKEDNEDEFGDFVVIKSETAQIMEEFDEVKVPSFPPEVHFKKVEKKLRKVMQKHSNNQFFISIDKEIVNYIQLSTYTPLTLSLTESFHRMICHGICQFYSLRSHSESLASGHRIVIVKKPKEGLHFPSTTLSQFLNSL